MASLGTIHVEHNAITDLGNDWFVEMIAGMERLSSIGLKGNSLKTVPDIYHGTDGTAQSWDLRDNPLDCGCPLAWMKDAENSNDRSLTVRLDAKPCSAPDEIADMDWAAVTWETLCPCEH